MLSIVKTMIIERGNMCIWQSKMSVWAIGNGHQNCVHGRRLLAFYNDQTTDVLDTYTAQPDIELLLHMRNPPPPPPPAMPRAEEDVSSRAKDQQFGLDLHLHPSFVNASSEGSNATSTKFSRAGYIDRHKSTSTVKSVLSGH